jgi:hypothetical protein
VVFGDAKRDELAKNPVDTDPNRLLKKSVERALVFAFAA